MVHSRKKTSKDYTRKRGRITTSLDADRPENQAGRVKARPVAWKRIFLGNSSGGVGTLAVLLANEGENGQEQT